MIINFQVVKVTGKKSGKCLCGKLLKRQKTFEQTVNPFNKNEKGEVCTHQEVYEKVRKEAEIWEKSPVRHNVPGFWQWSESQKQKYERGVDIVLVMECGEKIKVNQSLRKIIW